MADATYDAVIVGGGTKTLFTNMYLAKYAGMKVGIWIQEYVQRPDALVDYTWTHLSANRAVQELWDNVCLQLMTLRRLKGIGAITDVRSAITVFSMVVGGSAMCYVKGGTDNVAHACQRIFLENGGEFHTKQHVDRLEETLTCITWYKGTLHETPRYEAASRVNPGLADAHWVMLATKSLESLISEAYDRRLGRHPDPEGRIVAVVHHTRCDDTRAPAGKHTCITEQPTVPAGRMAERDAPHQPWPHGQPDGGGCRVGTRRQAAAHSGVCSISNLDSRPLRHRLSLREM